ncbi:hypothetical protein BG003_000505, partial [Podila horticola]
MSSTPEVQIKTVVEPPVAPNTAEVYVSTAKPRASLTEEDWANMDKPKVLIVGA